MVCKTIIYFTSIWFVSCQNSSRYGVMVKEELVGFLIYDMIYVSTAIALSPGGSSTVHIYTQTIHRTTQNKQYIEQHNNLGDCGPCPVLAR